MTVEKSSQQLEGSKADKGLPIVVIGAGPVGIDFCRKLAETSDHSIILYGDENYHPYNRVKLSLYLSGEVAHDDLYYDLSEDAVFKSEQVECRFGQHIVEIDRQSQTVVDEAGNVQPYLKLIIATGASSFVPPVKGQDCRGVYTFRDLKDADHLLARLSRSHKTVVVGAGLLGLEMAKGLNRHGTEVTVLDVNSWVLFRQLNEAAAIKVKSFFENEGVRILTNALIKEIVSNEAGQLIGYKLSLSDELIDCDTLIFATGARPNVGLARQAGLAFSNGIVVNSTLQTSDENIYAIGDCAEYQNQVHGIVSPGYEQASIAVNHILGLPGAYHGTDFTTVLKVAGIDVFCAGEESALQSSGVKSFEYRDDENGIYRCILTLNNRVVYVVGVGEWDEASRLAEAVSSQRRYWLLRFYQFTKTGKFYPDQESSVAYWPENAIVCNCMSVTRGSLSNSIMQGANSIEAVKEQTHACTVCGSCQPKIHSLIEAETGGKSERLAVPYAKLLTGFGLLAMLAVLVSWWMPAIPASNTFLEGAYDQIWLDGLYKQISGFTLLGLSLLAMSLAMSKRYFERLKKFFGGMRSIHTLIGVLTILVLLLHTGNSMGDGLNQWLLIDFMLVLVIGGAMALWLGVEHKAVTFWAARLRRVLGWGHILAVWALPVLLSFHVISVYYF